MSEVNITKEQIILYAKQLKLSGLGKYETILRQSIDQNYGYEEFLYQLLKKECEIRQENQQKRRIKLAGFPLIKTLDEFDFSKLVSVKEALIWELAAGDFISKRENIIMIGNPGTGKTHLTTGIALRACKQGFKAKYYTAAQLVTELAEAQEFKHLGKLEKQLSKIDLLILDELSYLSFSKHHSELLFQVLSERTERASLIVTTNLEFSKWTEFFQDTMLTGALVDRLTFKAHILNMNGSSYRLSNSIAAKEEKQNKS